MTGTLFAYEEVADFLAGLAPAKLLEIRPSTLAQSRVEELVRKKIDQGLTSEEQSELERFLALENLISLAKARARFHLASAA